MSSLRQRTLWRVMFLLLVGTGLLVLYNYHDSRHEINEVYDAHLAQNARLLQGVMSMPVQDDVRAAMYRAFNEALGQAGRHRVGHPYESKLAFQVWGRAACCSCTHRARPHLIRCLARRVSTTFPVATGNGAVSSCRYRKRTG